MFFFLIWYNIRIKMAKKKKFADGIVYSTNPNFKPPSNNSANNSSVSKAQQDFRIHLDRLGEVKFLLELLDSLGMKES